MYNLCGTMIDNAEVFLPSLLLSTPFSILLILYCFGVFLSNRKYSNWPIYKSILCIVGCFIAIVSVSKPLTELSHYNFTFHMLIHLLLGMLAPLLIALSTPMTLLFRVLHVHQSRKLTRVLRTMPFQLIVHPIITTLLNIGGLWILYMTKLFEWMHSNPFIYIAIHFHVFLAGYVFVVSIIYVEPVFHRYSFIFRTSIFIVALAAHGILTKIIYSKPPIGVPLYEAERGAQLMYYGGDFIEAILIVILFAQWYKACRPKQSESLMTGE
ncbi:cytochrome c oxidase assembly protein [Sutcliffiella cohnii]|nr:cytochrome c oxidase assembly protein [Sutcliffiella cohnii]